MRTFRVATYNVHKCRGLDGRVRPARIVDVLLQVRADVIGLQEVLSFEGGAPEENQAQYIADALGMVKAIGENRKLRGGIYGNVVLSRFPLQSTCNYDLSVAGREPRGCLRTDVDIGGVGMLHLFNIHMGTAFLERRFQGRRLLEEELLRSSGLQGPRIVLGDFNEWTRGLTSRLLSAEFGSTDLRVHLKRATTYPGLMPFLHLDHIYYDQELHMVSADLHKTRLSLVASDHLPLYADFSIPNR